VILRELWIWRRIIPLDMPRLLFHLRCLILGFAFVQCPPILHADECVKFHKRAPVKAVCGRVTNAAGERLTKVDLTLTGETGTALFTANSDNEGRFSFGSIPKGDYLLRAKGPVGYSEVQREMRVTGNNEKRCSPKIEISLGPGSCSSGARVKDVDKPSDLESKLVK
jgi:Carboxypeptidase regulatory-like domain